MSYDVSIQYIISDIFQKHDNYFNSKKETCKIMICSLLVDKYNNKNLLPRREFFIGKKTKI